MYCILLPQIASFLQDYTGKTQRYGLLIFSVPIIIYFIFTLKYDKIKKVKLPISLVVFFILLIIGFPFRNHSIQELLNMMSFLVPYIGIFILFNNIKNINISYGLIKKTLIYFIAISFFMIFLPSSF